MKRILILIIISLTFSLLIFGCKEKEAEKMEKAVVVKKEEVKEVKFKTKEIEEEKEPLTPEEQAINDQLQKIFDQLLGSPQWRDDFWKNFELEINENHSITVLIPEHLRRVELSDDKTYVFITAGHEMVGTIDILKFDTMDVLISEHYVEHIVDNIVEWDLNKVSYDAVVWAGNGFTIRERTTIDNGNIEKGEKFVGTNQNHGIAESFSKDYDPSSWKGMEDLVPYIKSRYSSSPHAEEIINASLFQDEEYTREEVIELIGIINRVSRGLDQENKGDMFEIFKLINIFYPLISETVNLGLISKEERDQFTVDYLEYMDLDRTLFPWLFE